MTETASRTLQELLKVGDGASYHVGSLVQKLLRDLLKLNLKFARVDRFALTATQP